jgi:cytoskeletal protein RodZ
MPPEVQQYYKSERRERTGVAWLLAIATLLITVAIILAIFLGGRWVYRKIRDRNTTTTTQTAETPKTTESGSTNSGANNGTTNQPSGNSSSSSSTPTNNGAATSNPNSSNSTNTGASSGSTTSGGVVGPTAATTSIPNTGPGDTIAIFFAVSLFGYLVHRYVLANKK